MDMSPGETLNLLFINDVRGCSAANLINIKEYSDARINPCSRLSAGSYI